MVQRIFKVNNSITSQNGWDIEDTMSGVVLDMPECIYEEMKGKYITSDEMLNKVDTLLIALAGVTDSLNPVIGQEISFERRSVLKSIRLKDNLSTIDDTIDKDLESVTEYEKYHTIYMDRDIQDNDNSIHAYIETPNNGIVRSQFDKSVRLEAKRNNIKYWVDDYEIATDSAGKVFIRPISQPVEIIYS